MICASSQQHADGSWGHGALAYHTTIAAVWGLRDGATPLALLGARRGRGRGGRGEAADVLSQLVEQGVWALGAQGIRDADSGSDGTCEH